MLSLNSVTKEFSDITAVNNVSFEAVPGNILGLIGPNGAGKSTIIRMIMNILAPDSGQILVDKKPISEKDKEIIGYLPEERGLYPKVSVNEMLLYLSSLKGVEKRESQQAIDEFLERFGLEAWKESKIETLSKGMSQKIQFISAVVHKPELIFLDEPFSGLDPVSTDLLREIILEYGKKGKTILFSTHNMENAERICNSIFLINRGKEIISGSMKEVKERYGKKTIIIEYDGDAGFVEGLSYIRSVSMYPRWMEIELEEGMSDRLLQDCIGKIEITKFEVSNPTLHNIFVDMVGKTEEGESERVKNG